MRSRDEIKLLSNSEANKLAAELRGDNPCRNLFDLSPNPTCIRCGEKLPDILVSEDSYDWFVYKSGNIRNRVELRVFFRKHLNTWQIELLVRHVCKDCRYINNIERKQRKIDRVKQVLDNAANPNFIQHVEDHKWSMKQKRTRKK